MDRLFFWHRFPRATPRSECGFEAEQGSNAGLPRSRAERLLAIDTGAERGKFFLEQGDIEPVWRFGRS
jgi:hypothetical protein